MKDGGYGRGHKVVSRFHDWRDDMDILMFLLEDIKKEVDVGIRLIYMEGSQFDAYSE